MMESTPAPLSPRIGGWCKPWQKQKVVTPESEGRKRFAGRPFTRQLRQCLGCDSTPRAVSAVRQMQFEWYRGLLTARLKESSLRRAFLFFERCLWKL